MTNETLANRNPFSCLRANKSHCAEYGLREVDFFPNDHPQHFPAQIHVSFRFHCVIMQLDFLSTPRVPWLSINYVSLGLDVWMTGTTHTGQDRTNGRESLKCTKMPSSLLQGLVVWLWRYGWRQGVG